MGEVGNIVARYPLNPRNQLDNGIDKNKVLRLYRDGDKEEKDSGIGEEHTKCEEETENSPRGADGRAVIIKVLILCLHGGHKLRRLVDTPYIVDIRSPGIDKGEERIPIVVVVAQPLHHIEEHIGGLVAHKCGTWGEYGVIFEPRDEVADESCTDTANKVVGDKPACSPDLLQDTAEHIECEHVEEEVGEIAMHKDAREVLPGAPLR